MKLSSSRPAGGLFPQLSLKRFPPQASCPIVMNVVAHYPFDSVLVLKDSPHDALVDTDRSALVESPEQRRQNCHPQFLSLVSSSIQSSMPRCDGNKCSSSSASRTVRLYFLSPKTPNGRRPRNRFRACRSHRRAFFMCSSSAPRDALSLCALTAPRLPAPSAATAASAPNAVPLCVLLQSRQPPFVRLPISLFFMSDRLEPLGPSRRSNCFLRRVPM